MRTYLSRSIRVATVVGVAALLASGVSCSPGGNAAPSSASSRQKTAISRKALAASSIPSTLGTDVTVALTAQRMTTTLRDGITKAPMWGFCSTCSADWAPGPTIIATEGRSLTINLTNNLPGPTSLVVLGQLGTGGGVGTPTPMAGPTHSGQKFTTFPGNADASPLVFTPPAQGQRVRSFGVEAAPGETKTLTWSNLKAGTYLYETGTLPSVQVPMGLYGVLVVKAADGGAYTGVAYEDDVALLFSEMDPVQNAAVDAAAVAGTDPNKRFNDTTCNKDANNVPRCYPAAVNYTPTYFLINGNYFDQEAPQNSGFDVASTATYSTGTILVRLLNAGSRTHVPSIVGLPMALVGEDGNLAPGKPKVQNEVLLTAGKTYDALVNLPSYSSATYPVFDRQLSLSNDNQPNGGMQGFLLINHAAAVAAAAKPGDPGMAPAPITPTSPPAIVASPPGVPTANPDRFTSNIAGKIAVSRPGVLANDTDSQGYALTVTPGSVTGSTCTSVALNADGSFTATGTTPTCRFSYTATNSQAAVSGAALVTVTFGTASNLSVAVVGTDPAQPSVQVPVNDYRWTLQEDLTFKHAVGGTPSVNTRTVGTSFHRSHMPVVATGCVGDVSCGSGQTVRGVAAPRAPDTFPGAVQLDKTKNYYLSILPGDAGTPVVSGGTGYIMGGAEIRWNGASWSPASVKLIKLQQTPIQTAQMSIFIYEDNAPTNGQNEPGESGLGGFNIILMDPAGRTGDVAGQQTFDAFNMPLSNYLLGRPGCPDELNTRTNGTGTSTAGNLVGAVYTCPNPPPGYTGDPAVYSLAGHALIQNLTPARYDVIAHPAAAREGAGEKWWQTETLEGTPAQDAFVGINEPGYFQEFGPPGPHVTIGFVNPDRVNASATGQYSITGKVTSQHMSHPSDVTLFDSGSYDMLSSTTCQVVLNSQAGDGPAVAAAQCAPDGSFTLAGVPAGDYDVAVFDQWLDQIIQNVAVTVTSAGVVRDGVLHGDYDMGPTPVLSWFTQYDQNIFIDTNKNGVYDDGEPGISNVALSVRFRNGAPAMTTLTDSSGNGLLVEMFPLFNWYVAEADTTRYKQTGVSIVVDGGGKPDTTNTDPSRNNLWTSHYATGEPSTRTELGSASSYSYGLQSFISQRNRVDWGRTPYVAGENGGIVGTVIYSSTRPFDDQRYNVQTIWEPLVPRVTVNLYRQETLADGAVKLTLVDTTKTTSWDDWVNLVYDAACTNPTPSTCGQYLLGSDGSLRNPASGELVTGVSAGIQVNLQCPGQKTTDPFAAYTLGGSDTQRCYDGWHNWNQVQGAPYDGRYAFPSDAYKANPANQLTQAQKDAGQTLISLAPGTYVVEQVTPPGYEIVKEEDKNILIGDAFVGPAPQQFGALGSIFILPDQATLNNGNPYNPSTGDAGFQTNPTTNLGVTASSIFFPECVGNLHRVPDYLSLFPQAQQVAPFAGMDRPLCDRKKVLLSDQMQASANFFVFTAAPVASNNTGIILDDASAEFNALAPDFGEKASVPFVPVSIKDFTGNEIGRTHSDQWGAYNMMTPSSWLVNPPTPSGYGPNMLVTCINDPGPIPDPAHPGLMITDPTYNPGYSNFCYTNPFMPGQTTYLDTPVLPIAAFAAGYNPADCALPDNSPAIQRVDGNGGVGPWLASTGGTLTITAQGDQNVPNPAYAGPFALNGLGSQPTIRRHYGFGATRGTVTIGGAVQAVSAWSDSSITVTGVTQGGELAITTAAGLTSVDTVTVNVGGKAPTLVTANTPVLPGTTPIQAAIDLATPGDLIMIDAGTYNELVVMWKPVRLQGVGAASVIINAAKYPTSKLEAWRPRINSLFSVDSAGNLVGTPQVDPLPTQEITGGVIVLEPTVLGSEEGAGITVLAKNLAANECANGLTSTFGFAITDSNFHCAPSRIDGISVTGGDAGGGIYVNGWAHGLEISNNRVYGNAGAYNGGIRVGVPYLELENYPTDPAGNVLSSGNNIAGFGYDQNVSIHHNSVTKNGTVEAPLGSGGAGGGVSICTGTDGYSLDHNWICGNFSSSDGAGVGHIGFSQGGVIANNTILFNQSFQQTASTHGGGIVVTGEPPIAGTLSLGTGDVAIRNNTIKGNFAEAGHGGGIRLQQVNGADIAAFPANHTGNGSSGQNTRDKNHWFVVTVQNNTIENNIAGWAGGGISLVDALVSIVRGNTIVENDSVGIAGPILGGGGALPGTAPFGTGLPNPAGVSSQSTSGPLQAAVAGTTLLTPTQKAISSPTLSGGTIARNRSFFYKVVTGNSTLCSSNKQAVAGGATCNQLPPQSTTGQCVGSPDYWDLGVLGDSSLVPGTAPGNYRLAPTGVTLTAVTLTNYAGATPPNSAGNGPTVFCNGSRAAPELPAVINPPTVKNFQVAATVDEGNNYVSLRYGPLTLAAPKGADLSVTKTDNRTTVLAGTTGVTYTIVVTNNGPQAITGGTLRDTLPGATWFTVTSWTCVASTGSSCTAPGAGGTASRAGSISLLNGGTATYTLVGNVPASAPAGASTNTVVVATPASVADPDLSNNTATDTDTIVPRVQGTVSFTAATPPGTLGGGALNFGNPAGTVSSTLTLTVSSASVTFGTAAVSGSNRFTKGADSCSGATVAAGGTCTITVNFNGAGTTTRNGTLSVPDDGAGSPQTLSLTGS
jgi:uncharacterized repeat protein (TIGR01451 family)